MNLTQYENELFGDDYAEHVDIVRQSVLDDIENATTENIDHHEAEYCDQCGRRAKDEYDLELVSNALLCSECYARRIEEAIYQRGLRETRRSMGGW